MQNPFSPLRTVQNVFLGDDTWVCPAGVTRVRALLTYRNYAQISGMQATAHVLTWDGDAWGAGISTNGQLGNSNVLPFSDPQLVGGGIKWASLATGSGVNFFGISTSGDAYGCGLNANGQLGIGSVIPKSSPALVDGSRKYRQLAKGSAGVVALQQDGAAYAWGLNTDGQIGDGTVTPRSSPTAVLGGLRFRNVAASPDASMGIAIDGSAYGWGRNAAGELGVGDVISRSSPVAVLGNLRFRQIVGSGANSAGQFFLGITIDGTLYAWGGNTSGQLGVGDVAARSSPVAVLTTLKWRSVGAGGAFALAIDVDGNAYAWGLNGNGQLGLGDVVSRSSPVLVLGSLKWTQVCAGNTSAYGIAVTGKQYGWGSNVSGQLGLGDVTARSSPVTNPINFLIYRSAYKGVVSDVYLDVVPGTSYPVTVLQAAATLGGDVIGGDVARQLVLTLEYQT